jgi:hypothetical protein
LNNCHSRIYSTICGKSKESHQSSAQLFFRIEKNKKEIKKTFVIFIQHLSITNLGATDVMGINSNGKEMFFRRIGGRFDNLKVKEKNKRRGTTTRLIYNPHTSILSENSGPFLFATII